MHLMEPESSSTRSQDPATCPSPQLDSPIPLFLNLFIEDPLKLFSSIFLCLPSDHFPSRFPTKSLYTPLLSSIRAICPAHLILLYVITKKIFSEKENHEVPHYSIASIPLVPPRPKYLLHYILKHPPFILEF